MCQFTTFSQSANFYFFQYLTFSRNNRDYMTTTTALKKIPFIRTNSYQTKELSTFYDGPLIKPIKTKNLYTSGAGKSIDIKILKNYNTNVIVLKPGVSELVITKEYETEPPGLIGNKRYQSRCRCVQCLRNLDRLLSLRTNVDVTLPLSFHSISTLHSPLSFRSMSTLPLPLSFRSMSTEPRPLAVVSY